MPPARFARPRVMKACPDNAHREMCAARAPPGIQVAPFHLPAGSQVVRHVPAILVGWSLRGTGAVIRRLGVLAFQVSLHLVGGFSAILLAPRVGLTGFSLVMVPPRHAFRL